MPEQEWNRVLSVNITSVFLCAKYCIPHMQKAGQGVIVNVASMQSFFNMPGSSAYAAAKGGIVSLTRASAVTGVTYPVDGGMLTAQPTWEA